MRQTRPVMDKPVPTARLPILLIALAVPALVPAHAADVAIRTPVGCIGGTAQCRTDISLAEARAATTKTSAAIDACLRDKAAESGSRRPDDPRGAWVCRAYADVTSHACGEVQSHGFWATVGSLADGPASLDTLKRHAETGRPFGEGRNRHVVVEAAESPPDEQHLALCSVRVIAGTAGPPHDCATVAIVRPDVTLLRSDVKRWESESLTCRASATFRLDGVTIDFGFVVDTGHGPEAFATPLGKLLREELGFATEMQVERSEDGKVTAVSFVAATAPRDSLILAGGWRESLNFDLRILRQGRGVGVSGTTRPMVCRQASGRLVDYSAPDDVQRSTYASVINDKIGRAIATACAEVTRIDDKNLVCK